ncbi:SDR family oxidoreductase [Rhizobium calliandrae]|uniref:SDR family oxidoreductase n=1 Tax=Rhizobium calliandrae TaxID=1312182 RepID=A0ABT7KF77_9HYPH|nr:SDR family oxidoreductase [Rhizobium calliandrae]MDL2406847.1 SDR family oxidoreductase [Rhizobium calliandrae]
MKSILITGAGTGLGRGAAIGLAQSGHKVIAAVHLEEQVRELGEEVSRLGLSSSITVKKLNLLDPDDIDSAVKWDFDTFVSNAGVGQGGPIAEVPMELVRRTFETNVFANLALTQKIVRKFVEAGTKGRLIFVSSMGGLMTVYGLGAYGATKHAIEAIASCLREELGDYGISVQTINPGPFATGFNDRMADSAFNWSDKSGKVTDDSSVRGQLSRVTEKQFDPQDMIDKMVEVIGADDGLYRNVWPPQIEQLVKEFEQESWTRTV